MSNRFFSGSKDSALALCGGGIPLRQVAAKSPIVPLPDYRTSAPSNWFGYCFVKLTVPRRQPSPKVNPMNGEIWCPSALTIHTQKLPLHGPVAQMKVTVKPP